MMGSETVVAALLGAAGSLAATAAWVRLTAPKLDIKRPVRTSVQGQAHFWGVQVHMAPPNVFPRHPALAVQARLQVRDAGSRKEITSFTCRWQGTPQPVVPTAPNQYVPNIAAIPFGQRGEVYQHKSEALDLFVKFDGEPAFYGFPNEAYFHAWRHPHFKFDASRYAATLVVRHDQDEHMIELDIANPSSDAGEFKVTETGRRYRSVFGEE